MDLMSQIAFKPPVEKNTAAKAPKPNTEETAAAEVVSFPTLLQENKKELSTSTGTTQPSKEGQGANVQQAGPQTAAELLQASDLFEGLSPLLSHGVEEVMVPEATVIAEEGQESATVPTPDASLMTEMSKGIQVGAEQQASCVDVPAAESNKAAATGQPADQLKIAEEAKTVVPTGGPEIPALETKTPQTPSPVIIEEEVTEEELAVSTETKAVQGKMANSEAKAPDSLEIETVKNEVKAQETQPSIPEPETMKVEVVKEASTPEQNSSPVVENPALARQSSAELDLLTAQAGAHKNYEQPAVLAENAEPAKPTLADLDLDSGSFETNDQKEKNITRILSAISESTSPQKKEIRGQVLSRVVEHLQEEIGKEKLTIRLNPEKLGQVEVFFEAQGDKLNITMSGSGKEAEQAIQEGTKELAENISDRSQRWNLVEIRVENRSQDQQSKQESRQDERRDKQSKDQHGQHEGHRSHGDHNQETGAGEWAAFHLGG